MKFIRLISDKANHAFYNMSLDEAISEAVRRELSPPTLRLYEWDRPSLSIGHFQKAADVDIDYCNTHGYPVVRRLTGGRAVLHDSELTYSLSSTNDRSIFNGSLLDNYRIIGRALVAGLNLCGIRAVISFEKKRNRGRKNPACFKSVSYGEITVKGKKIIGSAQKRYKNGFLQHGSLLLSCNAKEMFNVLGHCEEINCSDIGTVGDFAPGITVDDLRYSFKSAFEEVLNVKIISDGPTEFEMKLARELENTKYSTREWNFRR